MASLNRISIKGYRSIKELDLTLGQINILIGANGAGKSNFISFFRMLDAMMSERLQQYIGTSGRAESILYLGSKMTAELSATLVFGDRGGMTYQMRLAHAATDSLVFVDEKLEYARDFSAALARMIHLGSGHLESALFRAVNRKIDEHTAIDDHPAIEASQKAAKDFRQILTACRVYHFHDTSSTSRMRRFGLIADNSRLMPDAGNIAAILHLYSQRSHSVYRRIVSTIQKIMPEFGDFVLEPDRLNPAEIALNWRRSDSDYLFGPHQISDGTLRAMAIITLFSQPESGMPGIIILDEPELGLHPYALEIIAGLMRAAALHSQLLIATQSQTLLNHFNADEVIVVETKSGSSHFRRLDPGQLKDWLEDYTMGELWEKNVLGGGPVP